MNLNILFICAVFFVEVKTECGDYLTCLSELIHGFFGTIPKNSTVNENFDTNETDLIEIKDFSDKHLGRILDQVSSIVKNNVTGEIIESRSKTAEFMNDKTKVLVKVFEFDKPNDINYEYKDIATKEADTVVTLQSVKENVTISTSTEHVTEFPLSDMIHEVNNMAETFYNLEDNLILPDNYVDIDNNNTDYPNIDYLEIYKDATVEYVEFVPTQEPIINSEDTKVDKDIDNLIEYSTIQEKTLNSVSNYDPGVSEAVFPWITTIFVKNDSKDNQFEYYCDGALLNNRYLLTAGRCVNMKNATVNPDNLLIVLGKKSLHAVGDDEKVHKVKSITTHGNFTIEGTNDLAILEIDEPASLNGAVQAAILARNETDVENSATTAWGFTGDLTPIFFDKNASHNCILNSNDNNTYCATYANDVALCPSYGGLHVVKQTDKWYLRGIRTGDPERRGICIIRDVVYTDLVRYKNWIDSVIG